MPRSAPPGPPGAPPALGPASSAWLARTVVTGVCMIAAFVGGIVLGLIGLIGVATVIAVLLLPIAIGPWRRAALPLAAVAASISFGALTATRSDGRVDPSFGNHVEAIRPGQLKGVGSYRRGFGSLSVDLRNADLRPGSITDLQLRSDVGSVVVALDRKVCADVNVRWRPLEINLVADELMSFAHAAGFPELTDVPSSQFFTPNLFSPGRPDALRGLVADSDNALLMSIGGRYSGGPAAFFGQSLSRIVEPTPGENGISFNVNDRVGVDYRVSRRAAGDSPAVVNLDIQSGSGFVVRDYPAGIAIEPSIYGEGLSWPQEAQNSTAYATPVEPNVAFGEVRTSGEARGQWADWERTWVKNAKRRAVLDAGHCATRDALRDHWQYTGYAYDDGGNAGHALAVNGLGELVASSASGGPPATGSIDALARATDTTAISKTIQQERLKTYRAANLPEAR